MKAFPDMRSRPNGSKICERGTKGDWRKAMQEIDLKEIDKRIQAMKREADELIDLGESFPALYRNTSRILASIKI